VNNWFDHILFYTRSQPETSAMLMEDRVVTYGMLGIGIENCARRIASLDIEKDGLVAVFAQNPIRHLTLCLALFRIGIRSISLERGQSGIAGLKFAAVLGDGDVRALLDPANRFVEVTDAWFGPDQTSGSLPAGFSNYRQDCRSALTSGSTGVPKLFGYTIEHIGRHIPADIVFDCTHVLSMMGLSSEWGFVVACATLGTGKTMCFAASPFQAVRMIELFSIDLVLASTDQLIALARAARKSAAQLKSLRTVVTGGSVPARALLEAAMIYLCKTVLCRYGTSELGLVAQATGSEVLSKPGLVGHIVPGVEIAIFDARGSRCPPGQIGIVKGRPNPGLIGPSPDRIAEHAWIDVGDIGWMTSEGQLYVVGRTADLGAERLQPTSAYQISPVHEVENVLRLEWDAADAAAVVVDDGSDESEPRIWIGVVDNSDANAEKLEAILQQRGITHRIRLFDLPGIPRGANGKVNREQLKSLMLSSSTSSAKPKVSIN
jgi:acyl-coenzyme A synthetase/AMP-(fatty) acid ligase